MATKKTCASTTDLYEDVLKLSWREATAWYQSLRILHSTTIPHQVC